MISQQSKLRTKPLNLITEYNIAWNIIN